MADSRIEFQLIENSGLFDKRWYISEYPDVTASGLDPIEHYLKYGAQLLRNPSEHFDTRYYTQLNKEVLHKKLNPLVHYIRFGLIEGRSPIPSSITKRSVSPDAVESKRVLERDAFSRNLGEISLSVAWVINQDDKMTHQYRVYNYAEALAPLGVHTEVISQNHLSSKKLDVADVLVLCRVAANPTILRVIERFRASGRPVIFDIDDLIFDPERIDLIRHVGYRSDEERHEFRKMMAHLRNTLWQCDFATVSTYALKMEIERFGKPAMILPNNISSKEANRASDLISANKKQKDKRIRLGYFSGTKTHEHDFAECAEAIYDVLKKQSNVEFLVVGWLEAVDRFKEFGDRLIQFPLMRHEKMLEHLATVDVNLVPLEVRNSFTHCKSELKIFEAALYEVPTIASPTASNAAIIIDGQSGNLADSHDQWYQAITHLIEDEVARRRMGKEARRTIASRFMVDSTAREALSIFRAAKGGRIRPLPRPSCPSLAKDKVAISIISVLYKKREEVIFFLESMRRQSFDRTYEVLLVDDASPDDSVKIVEKFVSSRSALPDTNPNMSVRIIRNHENLGNCSSRNRAIGESSSELIVVVDADCLFNRDFLLTHYQAHQRGLCDVAIGPKGIETNGRPPMSVLNIHEADPSIAAIEARPQDGVNQDSFVNCVTRNFSINREFLDTQLGGRLFDELFNYSANPDSGFGWEDVEMGCRSYAIGARIKFLSDTVSIHVSHPPTVENSDKPYRSLRNFRRLHEKHPQLHLESRQWTRRTHEAITKWCRRVGGALEGNRDYQFLERHFDAHRNAPVIFTQPKTLRVLTFRWHCSHQYELYRIGHNFTLVTGLGTGLCEQWEWDKRPIPANARMRHYDEIDPRNFDIAILHFDENVLHPELCNGHVPLDWGRTFQRALREWALPKIAICHGTPQFRGQYDSTYDKIDLGQVIEDSRKELVDLLSDITVVCNSHQAREEWGFKKSVTIWHGFSPHDFPPNLRSSGALTMQNRALSNRPHYNGLLIISRIRDKLGTEIPIANLQVVDPPVTYTPRTPEWAKAKFENYARTLGNFAMYINPTVRSPMPRMRAEAMMAGAVSVSLRNHDVDLFIKNGVNGFYSDDAAELADQVTHLIRNRSACEKMRKASRLTALDVFNQDRYLDHWARLLNNVLA